MEDLQLEVEELIYKSDDQKLLLLAQHLKLEESDFVGKTKRLIVKNIKKEIDFRLETTFLMEIRSMLVENSDKQDTDEVPADMKSDEKASKEELEKAQSDLLEMQKKFKEMMEEQEKAVKIAQENLELSKKKVETIPNATTIDVSKLKDFKIKGQIGQQNQRDKLSYISLLSQINASAEKGYSETEICYAVVNSISGDLTIRKYLETIMKDLTLTKLKQHLRGHFKQRNSTELYQELINMSQKPDEDPQNFLMRALTIWQSILVNTDDDMGCDPLLVQKMFLKMVESGLREESIRSKLRPHLQNPSIPDEELCEQMKLIVFAELDRKQNFGEPRSRYAKIQVVQPEGAEKQVQEPKAPKQREAKPGEFMVALQAIMSEVADLKKVVLANQSASPRTKPQKPRSVRPKGCKKCIEQGTGNDCQHCYKCGENYHLARNCTLKPGQLEN